MYLKLGSSISFIVGKREVLCVLINQCVQGNVFDLKLWIQLCVLEFESFWFFLSSS